MKLYTQSDYKENLYETLLSNRPQIKDIVDVSFNDIDWSVPLTNEKDAIDRMKKAIDTQEKVAFIVDSDGDGHSSAVVMYNTLPQLMNFEMIVICERSNGYGIIKEYYDKVKDRGVSLVISADIGITAKEQVEYGKTLGIDTIITDHHPLTPGIVPDCIVVNPKLGDKYWYDLAGVGVIYTLIRKLYMSLDVMDEFDVDEIAIDHTVVGTVGDMVDLSSKVNRAMVKDRISKLYKTKSKCLKMFINGAYGNKINTNTIGFGITPYINSANRIGSIYDAVWAFITPDDEERYELYSQLVNNNNIRKDLQSEAIEDAREYIEKHDISNDKFMLVIIQKESSVAGLVASWITNKYGVPSLVLRLKDNNVYGGSGRSVPGCSMRDFIQKINTIDGISGGGHDAAFGVGVAKESLEQLKDTMKEFVKEQEALGVSFDFNKIIDAELHPSELLSDEREADEDVLSPFGMGNPAPLYSMFDVEISHIEDNFRHTFMELVWRDGYGGFDSETYSIAASAFYDILTDEFKVGDIVNVVFSVNDGSIIIDKIKKSIWLYALTCNMLC